MVVPFVIRRVGRKPVLRFAAPIDPRGFEDPVALQAAIAKVMEGIVASCAGRRKRERVPEDTDSSPARSTRSPQRFPRRQTAPTSAPAGCSPRMPCSVSSRMRRQADVR
jgi:hypothetical protein